METESTFGNPELVFFGEFGSWSIAFGHKLHIALEKRAAKSESGKHKYPPDLLSGNIPKASHNRIGRLGRARRHN